MAIVDDKIRCSCCKLFKALDDYYASDARLGYGKCKPCRRAWQLEYQRDNPEVYRKSQRKTRATNGEKYKQYHRGWREKNKAVVRGYAIKSKYGLSAEDYAELFSKQKGKCAICGVDGKRGKPLYVDHSHETGSVRGLLCHHCNTAIGMFKDDPDILHRAIKYLKGA